MTAALEASTRSDEARFFELDILRGLAAYLVIVFHYKHFLLNDAASFDYTHLPFHTLLAPVYVYGQYFVELFFSISGYVFFWLYADAIAEGRMGLRRFAVARLARLYPLYFVTFIAAALGQGLFHALYGTTFIYVHNTPGNFLLNLFMVQQWVSHAEMTFNGPSWSISVEIFLYAVFFFVAYTRLNRPLSLVAIVVVGLLFRYAQHDPTSDFSRGVPSFFLGGLAFYAVRYLNGAGREVWRRGLDTTLKWSLPALWLLTYVRAQPLVWPLISRDLHLGPPIKFLNSLTVEGFVYGLFPLTLLALGLRRENWRHPWLSLESLRRFAWVGDMSYSIYLIHFPLQLALMLVIQHWAWPQRVAIFASPLMFIAFFAMATGLARLSFVYLEMPMRTWLKRMLSGPRQNPM